MTIDVRPTHAGTTLFDALLTLGVIALFFIVVGLVASVFFFFGDVLLTFFLAWLLAFILSPVVDARSARASRGSREPWPTIIVYTLVGRRSC